MNDKYKIIKRQNIILQIYDRILVMIAALGFLLIYATIIKSVLLTCLTVITIITIVCIKEYCDKKW